jgi:hypothetical protein
MRPFLKLLGGVSALMMFFGTATGFIFTLMAVQSVLEESGWVPTTGTIVERVPYHGKRNSLSYTVVYEYELDGHTHRCHGHHSWRDDSDELGNTIEMLVQPKPPHTVRFGSPSERKMDSINRLAIWFGLVVTGAILGFTVKRADPEFDYHPWKMAGITFLMLFLLMFLLSGMELIRGAFRDNGIETTATVVELNEVLDAKQNREYQPVFEHRIGDNVVRSKPVRNYREPPCRVGEEMTIRYDRANVERVAWSPCDDGARFLSPACVPCFVALVLGVLCFVRSAKLYPPPPERR